MTDQEKFDTDPIWAARYLTKHCGRVRAKKLLWEVVNASYASEKNVKHAKEALRSLGVEVE